MQTPIAILCSDLHLRETTPECRTDNFLKAMRRKVRKIGLVQEKYNVPIIHAGDLFDSWKCSHELVRWAVQHLPEMYSVAGQHELRGHLTSNLDKSPLGVLIAAKRVRLLSNNPIIVPSRTDSNHVTAIYGSSWGDKIEPEYLPGEPLSITKIAVIHQLVWHKKKPFPGAPKSGTARSVIKQYPWADVIVSGDNHEAFSVTTKTQRLVNCGSVLRTTAKQVNHEPRIWLLFADRTVKRVYFRVDPSVISREHIDQKAKSEAELESFIERLREDVELGLEYESNLQAHFQTNKERKQVEDIVWRCTADE